MSDLDIALLNQRFGAAGRIAFRADEAGLPVASLAGKYGACEVALYGAHTLSYRPAGLGPVLFAGKGAAPAPGRDFHGGIPVCWPWFGRMPGKPIHGFAGMMPWGVCAAEYSGEATELRLELAASELSRQVWDFAFGLTLRVCLGQHLTLELATENRDTRPFELSQGFHPYFRVSDISAVSVHGLDGARFTDYPSAEVQRQRGALTVGGETNRIYTPEKNEAAIHDGKLRRVTLVTFSGTRNLVVWNPWAEDIKRFADLAPDDYTRMLCVEPANLGDTSVTLEPGERHTLKMDIQARLM